MKDWSPDKPRLDSMRFIWPNITSQNEPSPDEMFHTIKALLLKHNQDLKWEGITRRNWPHSSPSVNFVDLAILQALILEYKVKNVIEVGMGVTTTAMCAMDGVHVDVFSIGDITPASRRDMTWNNMDVRRPEVLEKMCGLLPNAQLILIDGPHSYEFAQKYTDGFLNKANNHVVFIHDHYGPQRPYVDGEQNYNQENVFGKTHDLLFYTDIGSIIGDRFKELGSILGHDISDEILKKDEWKKYSDDNGLDGPTKDWIAMASIVLKSK